LGNFARVLHHLDMKDVKKRHLKELAARKIKEEQDKKEKKVIQEIAKKYKSDWRKDLKENFTAVPSGPTNSVSQTFQHVSGQNFSFSGLGGQETHPSTVTVFGDGVPAPNYNQLALAGYAKPLGNVLKRNELEDTNSKLDASQEFAQKVGADVMMNARVKTDEEKPDFVFGRDDPTMSGVMKDPEEIKMNEKLYKFQEIYSKTVERNNKITSDHEKNVLAPYVNKLLSPLKLKKVEGRSPKLQLYKNRQVSNEDGDIIVRIDSNSNKVTFTKYTLINGRWSSSEKSFDQPRLRSLPTMPKFLQDWQSQSIDPSFAIPRSDGAILAKKANVESAFNLVNYYIDNHVKTMAGMDPSRKDIRHDVTNLYSEKSKDWLKTNTDDIKFVIDDMIKRGSSNEEISKRVDQLLVFKQPRDISNSIGNAMGFDVDYYKQTGNYAYNSTYKFTSTYDMGIRGKLSFLSGAAQKYVSGQLDGETGMAVQNPMQFRVEIESGKQYAPLADPLEKEEPKKPTKLKTQTKEPSRNIKWSAGSYGFGVDADTGEDLYLFKNPDGSIVTTAPGTTLSSPPLKTVKRIKSMSKARNQSMSLDEPIVRRKKKGVDI